MSREALIVGTGIYRDQALRRLRSPAQDVSELRRVLADRDVGGYSVRALLDPSVETLAGRVCAFFANRAPDDVLLLYFTGHGIKDVAGELFLAARDTRVGDPQHTALSTDELNRWIRDCRSRRIVLILDCCYSGAFPRGMFAKADGQVHVQERFGGRGLAIITASTAIEYAFEGGELRETAAAGGTSVFTGALVRGLDTGEADDNLDQKITLDELYYYVFDTVRAAKPGQTPCWWLLGGQGTFMVAERRPGTIGRRVSGAGEVQPATLRPDRWAAVSTVPAAVFGVAVGWLGLTLPQGRLWSLVLVGAVLLVVAARRATALLLEHTVLDRFGVSVRGIRARTVSWPSIFAIEARWGPFGRTVALWRSDSVVRSRLTLPVSGGAWGTEQAAGLRRIREYAAQRGSPVNVVRRGWTSFALRGLPLVGLALVLLVGADRPWTWEGVVATDLPRACAVLTPEKAEQLIDDPTGTGDVMYPLGDRWPPQHTPRASSCVYPRDGLLSIGPAAGRVSLRYVRFTASRNSTAAANARRALNRRRAPYENTVSLPLADDAYQVGGSTKSMVQFRCGNVLAILESTIRPGLEVSIEPDRVASQARKNALPALRQHTPGLC